MKNFYRALLIISAVCATGDCDNFLIWSLWELLCVSAFVWSSYKVINEGE